MIATAIWLLALDAGRLHRSASGALARGEEWDGDTSISGWAVGMTLLVFGVAILS